MEVSDVYASVKASLREGLDIINQTSIREIICFGLGRIGESTSARYQLALLLCLKELYQVKVYVYDPVFGKSDKHILKKYGCEVLGENIEGKYRAKPYGITLFYLPHCPKQLCNNLLWSNWGIQLSNCVVICNSFLSILENTPKRVLSKSAEYIFKIAPYVVELAVINNFKYYDIFNDTAIHIFPSNDIILISEEFWESKSEPHYSDDDIEFVTSKVHALTVTP